MAVRVQVPPEVQKFITLTIFIVRVFLCPFGERGQSNVKQKPRVQNKMDAGLLLFIV